MCVGACHSAAWTPHSGAEVVGAEGINSQAPTEVQSMIISLYVSCLYI